ncbi:MAG: hypothetical protein DRO23_11590 [Thermoprotei archaeon]|nr:MAG: hypothetical protein DRO23_11590 [Thermoprotei archaeon]
MRKKDNKSSKGRKRRKRIRSRSARINVENIASTMFSDISLALGISHLGLTEDELKKVAKSVIEYLLSNISYKPSKSVILNRVLRGRLRLAPIVSETILNLRKELNEDLLEYVINFGGPVCAANVRRLYIEVLKRKREDLLGQLRETWDVYGKPLPIRCPRCGFSSIKPDLTCVICGYCVKEEEFKEIIGFNDLFHIFLELTDELGLRRTLENQVVVYDPNEGLKPPPPRYGKVQYIVPLGEKELVKIEEKLGLRKPCPKEIRKEHEEKEEKVRKEERKVKEKPTLDMFLRVSTE